MEIRFIKERIEFEKEINSLDRLTIDFSSVLNKLSIKYVIVSGYVSILFGRNRSSEDIDLILEKTPLVKFKELWNELEKKFECINAESLESAYNNYLMHDNSVRFSRKGNYIPNIEIKFPKLELDFWTLRNSKEVLFNGNKVFISPIEIQIPFKLFLGSEKDIEDAKYLYNIFKDNLDINLLKEFNRKLKIEHLFDKYIK